MNRTKILNDIPSIDIENENLEDDIREYVDGVIDDFESILSDIVDSLEIDSVDDLEGVAHAYNLARKTYRDL